MSLSRPEKFDRLLAPRSIAFVGGSIAAMAIRRCLEIGFSGEIWPVHPKHDEIAGYPCFKSLDDLPGVPDAAYIGVNRELTIEMVRGLSSSGAGGCVCYAAGYAEMGEEGQRLQQELVQAAGDMPLVGPNCFGLVNYVERCALWPYLFGGAPVEKGVALVSQSGNIAMNLTMNQRSVNFTHVIGAGNQAVLGPADYVDALLRDDRVTAIGMYIEGFDDVNHFAATAKRAAEKGVPIVVMKVGKTEASAKQSSSHTSALTGSDVLYDALFERLGIIRVNSLNRLLETLKILDLAPALTGRNIFTLSCSGGEAATIADLAPAVGLDTHPFSDEQVADLESQFPNYVTVSNPFDYNTSIWGDLDALTRCFTSSMQGTHDAAFLVYDHPTVESPEVDEWLDALDAFVAAHKTTGKPAFVICTISELLPKATRDRMLKSGVVPLQGLEDGLYAYAQAATYYEFQRDRADRLTLPRAAAPGPHDSAATVAIDEAQSKKLLQEFGLSIPAGETVAADQAPEAAARLGYPVAVKAVGDTFVHKSDVGAVALNLDTQAEVAKAVSEIANNAARNNLQADRFLVERMVEGVLAEFIVGIKRDEQFGPVLVIGSGGVLVELLQDSVSLLLPCSRDSVRAAISGLAASHLLAGFRGRPKGDTEALVDAVLAIAAYADSCWGSLIELDVNPLMVLAEGKGVVAADALIICEQGQV